MVIDVHAHCIPEAFRRWLEDHGDQVGASVVDGPRGRCVQFRNGPRTGPQYSWQSMTDLESRLDAMDRMGIDVQVLGGWIDLAGYEVPEEHCLRYARAHNETLAEAANTDPLRFRAIGTAPLQSPGAAVAALEHAIDELGMIGVQIASRIGNHHLGSGEELEDFWAGAAERQALVILHPVRPLAGVDLGRFFLDNALGRPAESSIALGGLIMSGVLERHPALEICVVHGAGFIPYQIGRLDRAYEQAPETTAPAISRSPSSFLDQVYADSIVHDAMTLEFLIRRIGPDHVVIGTDYPFPMGDDDPVGLLGRVPGLSQTDFTAILGNAARWTD